MRRVLVVDDDFGQRQLIQDCLKDRYECDTAVSGEEALRAYELSRETGRRYSAILLDRMMEGMEGSDVVAQIRAREEKEGVRTGEGVPIIMITGKKKDFTRAFDNGCDGYILKPFGPQALRRELEERIRP